eukprot:scaffold427_cov344-Prasinococcus_capsulatus_cf.AAC.2
MKVHGRRPLGTQLQASIRVRLKAWHCHRCHCTDKKSRAFCNLGADATVGRHQGVVLHRWQVPPDAAAKRLRPLRVHVIVQGAQGLRRPMQAPHSQTAGPRQPHGWGGEGGVRPATPRRGRSEPGRPSPESGGLRGRPARAWDTPDECKAPCRPSTQSSCPWRGTGAARAQPASPARQHNR